MKNKRQTANINYTEKDKATLKEIMPKNLLEQLKSKKNELLKAEEVRIQEENKRKHEEIKEREKNKTFEELLNESNLQWKKYK
jgi:hypothetical protein